MSIIGSNILAGASGQAGGGYEIERSVRLNSPDSAYLSRTPGTAGDRRTFTWAGWVKRSGLGANQALFEAGNGSVYTLIWFNSSDKLGILEDQGSGGLYFPYTAAVFRDTSAWYHIVVAVDTTQATSTNRIKIYVNGVQQTIDNSYPSQNLDTYVNSTNAHRIGYRVSSSAALSAYLAECYLLDGIAADPSSFGEFDTNGVWQPIDASGLTFGTNGFHLPFSDNSTAAALGTDTSGNSNTWTVNNISVTAGAGNDSLVDSPTNGSQVDTGVGGEVVGNYCTWNPLNKHAGVTLSNGNLDFSNTASSNRGVLATIGLTSGKFYIESFQSTGATDALVTGFIRTSFNAVTNVDFPSDSSFFGYTYAGRKWSFTAQSNGNTSLTVGADILCFAIDLDAGKAWAGKNGVWFSSGDPATGANPYWTFTPSTPYSYATVIYNATGNANFGQRAFAYTAPSGFKALCTTNLPEPTIADGSTVMDVKTFTGNHPTGQSITSLNFSPDFVWLKDRAGTNWHYVFDTIRGTEKAIFTNATNAENTYSGTLTSFNSDGFTLGSDNATNQNGNGYVAWCWDAGSSTVTNTDGSITSQVRANASAGFSVVTYSFGNAPTVGHGLGVAPSLIIAKSRTVGVDWVVYHRSLGKDKLLVLNGTSAEISSANYWGSSEPSSTVFGTIGNNTNSNNQGDMVAYCFAPVAGYSAYGSYTGNGSTDGPFVWCGFRPRYLLIKHSSSGSDPWIVRDTARDPYNSGTSAKLAPNYSYEENNSTYLGLANQTLVDFTSNGFKVRSTGNFSNASGETYIYAAFAEHPFAYARAR
jgi:hypothetical protein